MERMSTICILGLGYIGLPTAAMFATHGMKVHGVDVNDRIIHTLNNGDIHIHEPGLKEIVNQAIESSNLKISLKPNQADAFIIAVPTPFQKDIAETSSGIKFKKADMSYVISATESILPYLKAGNLVILESTSPPRTTIDLVQPILERNGLKAGKDFYLAYSPERVLPGKILEELVNNARVIGGIDQDSAEAGRDLYASFVKGEILLTDSTTAEMTKLMENTYRDVNIALANEFSRLAEPLGFDVWEAIELANHHPRVNILKPGIGVGGHCISVDPWFLVEAEPEKTQLILKARQVNDSQPEFVVEYITKVLGGSVKNKRIAVLGLSYKPDIDDLRESPAVEVSRLLSKEGALVSAFEPNNNKIRFTEFEIKATLDETIQDANVIIILVPHKNLANLFNELEDLYFENYSIVDLVNSGLFKLVNINENSIFYIGKN